MHLPVYLGLLDSGEQALADSFDLVAEGHGDEPDVRQLCRTLAAQCRERVAALRPVLDRYGEKPAAEPERLHAEALPAARTGAVGLLRDLQDLVLLATLVDSSWTVVCQAAQGLRDRELLAVVCQAQPQVSNQLAWLTTRIKSAAPQALLAAA
ncbi:hypothetical protein QEZ54_06940 [Catellatospora sp. KI3]|uniref:hypothetical protein n=1 Tax=Catellatospora sp. KI3 TaxID=3041620 RepID=UPI0024825801|nr:hypothetical protein [Catellatospora sp. KI3]MDI1460695.1 hypothetical protein [Catellatospora sp. KI3]